MHRFAPALKKSLQFKNKSFEPKHDFLHDISKIY